MSKKLIALSFIFLINFSCGEKEGKTKEVEINENSLDNLSENELIDRVYNLEKDLIDTTSLQANKEKAIYLLDASNKFAELYPKNEKTENIQYKAVLAAKGLGNMPEAIRVLSKLIIDFPNSTRKVDYLFEKAFLLEDQPKGKDKAKKVYQEIADTYPNHQFGKDSKARLKTIDMTDEELMEFFSQQNAK